MKPAEIVVIEDNQADVFLIKLALEEYAIPYVLTWFRNGLEAVLTLCVPSGLANAPCPDVILLDLNTPRSDGFEILAKLQQTPRLA
jgi:CheY-like chemotaxis protein